MQEGRRLGEMRVQPKSQHLESSTERKCVFVFFFKEYPLGLLQNFITKLLASVFYFFLKFENDTAELMPKYAQIGLQMDSCITKYKETESLVFGCYYFLNNTSSEMNNTGRYK